MRGVKLAARSSAGNAAAVAVVAIPTAPGIVRAALEAAKSRSMTRGKLIKLLKPEFGDNASRKLRRAVDLIRRTSKLVYAKPAKVEPTFTLKG